MVTRILKYEDTLTANQTDGEMGSKSPGSGKEWEVQEVYGDTDANVDYSLSYEERKLFDNIPGDQIADEDNGIPFNLSVGESEDLAILASETNGDTPTARFYIRVDETQG
jgi:hypothetical protein